MLTLLKQRKISCILKVESLQRGIGKDQEVTEGMTDMADVEKELEEVERKMSELEKVESLQRGIGKDQEVTEG